VLSGCPLRSTSSCGWTGFLTPAAPLRARHTDGGYGMGAGMAAAGMGYGGGFAMGGMRQQGGYEEEGGGEGYGVQGEP
jgi:hypothetical protein